MSKNNHLPKKQQHIQNNSGQEIHTVSVQEYRESYRGPMPHPVIIEGYEKVIPGSAEKIINEFLFQGEHRRELEKAIVSSDIAKEKRGQWMAFTIFMVLIVSGVILQFFNKEIIGLVTSLAGILPGIGVFIYGKHSKNKELKERRTALKEAKVDQ